MSNTTARFGEITEAPELVSGPVSHNVHFLAGNLVAIEDGKARPITLRESVAILIGRNERDEFDDEMNADAQLQWFKMLEAALTAGTN